MESKLGVTPRKLLTEAAFQWTLLLLFLRIFLHSSVSPALFKFIRKNSVSKHFVQKNKKTFGSVHKAREDCYSCTSLLSPSSHPPPSPSSPHLPPLTLLPISPCIPMNSFFMRNFRTMDVIQLWIPPSYVVYERSPETFIRVLLISKPETRRIGFPIP